MVIVLKSLTYAPPHNQAYTREIVLWQSNIYSNIYSDKRGCRFSLVDARPSPSPAGLIGRTVYSVTNVS